MMSTKVQKYIFVPAYFLKQNMSEKSIILKFHRMQSYNETCVKNAKNKHH